MGAALVLVPALDQKQVILRALNFYVPPAYDAQGDPLPRDRRGILNVCNRAVMDPT
jgi:hypothetical protein